jgi:ankyrin repeat protein
MSRRRLAISTILKDPGYDRQSRLRKVQRQLLQAIHKGDRTEALYQLCIITPEGENDAVIPESALALAVRNNWTEVVTALLQLNAKPDDADEIGQRGIHYCIELGYEECARLLLNYGASTEATLVGKDKRRRKLYRPMHSAVAQNRVKIVQLLLDHGCKEKDGINDEKLTPLMVAACMGRTKVARVLLQTRGVTIERKDLDRSPLSCAAEHGHVDIIQLLLDTQRVDIERKDKLQRTPLWLAICNGHADAAKLLIEKGANIEARELSGQTPFLVAARKQFAGMLKLLREKGADVNAADNLLTTPLMAAASLFAETHTEDGSEGRGKRIKIVKLLLQYEPDVEIKNEEGLTALAQAARSNNTEILKLLLEHGADHEARDKKNRTPLMHAVKKGASKAVCMLLDAGADIEGKDAGGRTALFYAPKSTDMLTLMIDRGANLEARNNDGQTLLMVVQVCRCWDTVLFLLGKGADGEVIGLDGVTVNEYMQKLQENDDIEPEPEEKET